MSEINLDKREIWKGLTVTIIIHDTRVNFILREIGMWLVEIGLRIAGVGKVVIE